MNCMKNINCIKNIKNMENSYNKDYKYLTLKDEGFEEDCGIKCCLPCLFCNFFTGLIFLTSEIEKEKVQYCYFKFYK